MSKCDILQPNSNVNVGFQMQKCDIPPEYECQNEIFGPSSNVKIGFRMAKCYIRPNSNDKIGYQTSKCNNRPEFESQNRIIRYLAQVLQPYSNVNVGFQM